MKDKKKYINQCIMTIVGLAIVYGFMHYAHKQCIEKALEMRVVKFQEQPKVVSVKVPWWDPIPPPPTYSCSAVLEINGKQTPITFDAERVGSFEGVSDVIKGENNEDWEANLGFWGWIGDDYHIKNIQMTVNK